MTGRHLDERAVLKPEVRQPTGRLPVRGACSHNLRSIDVDLPLGVLVALTGVAGSGKSSLVEEALGGRDGVVVVDQCDGKRFQAEVLRYHLGGKDISQVLAMSVTQAQEFFATGPAHTPAAGRILDRLADVGLGYLALGQPLTTLAGGERQRLKLAASLGRGAGVLVLDEPTAGLHPADVAQLLRLLDRLVDGGTSVIVIEHSQAVMAHADWIVDLGPWAGSDGGRVVFEGSPARLVADPSTVTGQHLAAYLSAAR